MHKLLIRIYIYTIIGILRAILLVVTFDLLEDRCIDDVIETKFLVNFETCGVISVN